MLDVETLGAALKLAKKGGGGGGEGGSGAVIDDSKISSSTTWSSQKIVDTLCPPFTTSGAMVQCTPVANYPLGVKASWEPRQEGTGDPSPENVRPIVGLDSVQVTRCGKNLWNFELAPSGNSWAIPFLPQGNYVLSMLNVADWWTENANGKNWYLRNAENTAATATVSFVNTVVGERAYAALSVPYSGAFRLNTFIANVSSHIQDIQLEAGSIATAYAPYTGTTATLTLPGTIYGGTVDVGTEDSERTVDVISLAVADMDNSESFPGWQNQSWITNYVENTNQDTLFAMAADYLASNADGNKNLRFNSYFSVYFVASDLGYTQSKFKEQYPNLVFQFAFRRITPELFHPTSTQQILAISGTNTLYADAGNITVTGVSDPGAAIATLQDRLTALENNTLN